MRCARRFGGSLLAAVFLAGTAAAVAQEVQFDSKALDTKALDTSGASAAPAKRKGKKAAAAPDSQPQQPAAQGGAKPGANRQFGELEGWSPGKEPPKPKDKYDPDAKSATSPAAAGRVNVTPSGNMNVGLPF
jgi:hypothetical protein